MALTFDGKVYSWGDGNEGKLGHGNRADCLTPRLIEVSSLPHAISDINAPLGVSQISGV